MPFFLAELPLALTTVTTVLVYFMQFGFIAFEAGAVAQAYRLQSAVKNLLVFMVSFLSYSLLGLHIHASVDPAFAHASTIHVALHAGFASTVSLIIANTVTERTTLATNLMCAVASASIAYPLMAGLAWGDGWLHQMGFRDAAGACVVHLLGGTTGFLVALVVGPRFRQRAWRFLGCPPRPEERTLIPFTIVGAVFLWFGWLGFNSAFADGPDSAKLFETAFFNTSLGASAGALAALGIAFIAGSIVRRRDIRTWREDSGDYTLQSSQPRLSRRPLRELADLERIVIGMMGGLVVVTANAIWVQPYQAVIESGVGGAIAVITSAWIVQRAKRLDDPLGAVATHAISGIIGLMFSSLWLDISPITQAWGALVCVGVAAASAVIACGPVLIVELISPRLDLPARLGDAGLFGFLKDVGLLRLSLTPYQQITGKRGTESWAPKMDADLAVRRLRQRSPYDMTWRMALAVASFSESRQFAEEQVEESANAAFGHEEVAQNEQYILAAIAIFGSTNYLEKCLSRAKSLRENDRWFAADETYRETLVWTIGALAERWGMDGDHQDLPRAGIGHAVDGLADARTLLLAIKDDFREIPNVRNLARLGLVAIETTPLYAAMASMRRNEQRLISSHTMEVAPTIDGDVHSILVNLNRIHLRECVVVGSYYRWEAKNRDTLRTMVARIESPLVEKTKLRENFIIWAQSGTGKTFLVEQVVAHLRTARAVVDLQFVQFVLSKMNSEEELVSTLAPVAATNTPVLCLVDEVDGHSGKKWPYRVLFKELDSNRESSKPIVFVLIASTGVDLQSALALITADRDGKGSDLANRLPTSNRFSIPAFSLGDYLPMIAGHTALSAKGVSTIEKAALAYILQNKALIGAAHTLNDFLEAAANRVRNGTVRLSLHHLFDMDQDEDRYLAFRGQNKATLAELNGNVEIAR